MRNTSPDIDRLRDDYLEARQAAFLDDVDLDDIDAGHRIADQAEARARAYVAPTWADFDEEAQARSDAALREHDLEVEARIALKNNPRMGA